MALEVAQININKRTLLEEDCPDTYVPRFEIVREEEDAVNEFIVTDDEIAETRQFVPGSNKKNHRTPKHLPNKFKH